MADSIFRKQSLDRVNSPEQLNDYIKTSRPSVWLVIFAVLILILSFFVWGIFGTLDTKVTVDGVAKDNVIVCFASGVDDIKVGDEARIGNVSGIVKTVSEKPISAADATALADTDEYTLYCLNLEQWNYVVEIAVDNPVTDGYVSADITIEEVSPISFVFG